MHSACAAVSCPSFCSLSTSAAGSETALSKSQNWKNVCIAVPRSEPVSFLIPVINRGLASRRSKTSSSRNFRVICVTLSFAETSVSESSYGALIIDIICFTISGSAAAGVLTGVSKTFISLLSYTSYVKQMSSLSCAGSPKGSVPSPIFSAISGKAACVISESHIQSA